MSFTDNELNAVLRYKCSSDEAIVFSGQVDDYEACTQCGHDLYKAITCALNSKYTFFNGGHVHKVTLRGLTLPVIGFFEHELQNFSSISYERLVKSFFRYIIDRYIEQTEDV